MIGLIPAAGQATRIQGLPKYLLPVPGGFLLGVHCQRMKAAGASYTWIGANRANYEFVNAYTQQNEIVYGVETQTMSETLLKAKQWCVHDNVLFGMPDSYWLDEDVYKRLAANIEAGALVSAAVFEAKPGQHTSAGMCDVKFDDDELIITRVVDKPDHTSMRYLWGAMAWQPGFWRYIQPSDPHVGFALQRAVEAGEIVPAYLAYGGYWDCGTPERYFDCIRHLTEATYA